MRLAVIVIALGMVLGTFAGCSYLTGKTTGQSLDDTVISGDIKGKILRDPELKTWAVDVNVYQGNVTLSGMVPSKAAEDRLIQLVENTKGVKSVRTNLQVGGQKAPASSR